MIARGWPYLGIALVAAVVLFGVAGVVLTAAFPPKPEPPEMSMQEAVDAFHGALCSDPRGTLADGSCEETGR